MNITSRLLILTASCFVGSYPFCLVLTFGTLYLPLLENFNEDRATTATVQSLLMGVTLSTGIIWGILCRNFELWKVMFAGSVLVSIGLIISYFANSLNQLIFCISILSGIGTSIVYVCCSATVASTFENKGAGIALAAYNCSIGIGAASYPFLLDFFLNKYDLSGTFLLLGGLNLNNLVVAQLYYNNIDFKGKSENSQETEPMVNSPSTVKTLTSSFVHIVVYIRNNLSRTKGFRFGVFIIAIGLSVGSLNGFLVVISDVFASKSSSGDAGLYSITVMNACSIFGRLLPILFQMKTDVHPMAIFILCSLLGCVGQVVILQASNVSLMYFGCALSGIAMGGFISGGSVAILYFVHKEMFSAAFGLMITSNGILSSVSGPLYGWMRDEFQSYDTVNGMTAGVLGFTTLIFFLDLCVTKQHYKPSWKLGFRLHSSKKYAAIGN